MLFMLFSYFDQIEAVALVGLFLASGLWVTRSIQHRGLRPTLFRGVGLVVTVAIGASAVIGLLIACAPPSRGLFHLLAA